MGEEKSVPDHTATGDPSPGFMGRLAPLPRNGGYREDDWWIWGGSVIAGDDGKFHMFASRWNQRVPFSPNWLTNSEVVRAVSSTAEGPYSYVETVLPTGDLDRWDGGMTHNPTIHRCPVTGKLLLFYTGSTFAGPQPTQSPANNAGESQGNQRIGLAVAESPSGPWERPDAPIIEPRPGGWDGRMVSNAAPCVLEDGTVLLGYKSHASLDDQTNYGLAQAERFDEPFHRVADEPLFEFADPEAHIEDAYIWEENGKFQMIFKDRTDRITGEEHAGAHATSSDAIRWELSDPPKAYSRTVRWSDGEITTLGSLERPQLLIQNGRPTHLFAGCADGPGGFWRAEKTWNQCVPFRGTF